MFRPWLGLSRILVDFDLLEQLVLVDPYTDVIRSLHLETAKRG